MKPSSLQLNHNMLCLGETAKREILEETGLYTGRLKVSVICSLTGLTGCSLFFPENATQQCLVIISITTGNL